MSYRRLTGLILINHHTMFVKPDKFIQVHPLHIGVVEEPNLPISGPPDSEVWNPTAVARISRLLLN
uniref:SAR3 n=1 Tax=Arundo donax TaxID=35708 RepID=A0A0A8Y2V5_ARUDO